MIKKNLGLDFWVHWLVFGAMLDNVEKFRVFCKLCKQYGVKGIEIPFEPLLALPVETVARVMSSEGIEEAAVCVFFADGAPNPCWRRRSGGTDDAMATVRSAIAFTTALRAYGVRCHHITGPWGHKIPIKYAKPQTKSINAFARGAKRFGDNAGITMCLELLRREENNALYPGQFEELVNEVGCGAHLDSFHYNNDNWNSLDNGPEQSGFLGACRALGKNVAWIHASGSNRHTPGHPGDCTNWQTFYEGIDSAIDAGAEVKSVCFEGFGPSFRNLVKEIGEGFPLDLPPEEAIPLARRTMEEHHVVAPVS